METYPLYGTLSRIWDKGPSFKIFLLRYTFGVEDQ